MAFYTPRINLSSWPLLISCIFLVSIGMQGGGTVLATSHDIYIPAPTHIRRPNLFPPRLSTQRRSHDTLLQLLRGGATGNVDEDTTSAPSADPESFRPHPLTPALARRSMVEKARDEAHRKAQILENMPAKQPSIYNDKDDEQPRQTSPTMGTTNNLVQAYTTFLSSSSFLFSQKPLWTYYLWTLVGTSVVWHLFFYLLSVGYAAGIGLTVLFAMLHEGRVTLPALLVVAWSIRLATFLLWREYKAWPAWHARMQAVAQQQRDKLPPTMMRLVTLGSWLVYAAFYYCMALPVLWSLRHESSTGGLRRTAFVLLQTTGLVLESLADWQKAQSKRTNPKARCTTGLWQYSTHPNYLGELWFWWGTLAGGLVNLRPVRSYSDATVLLAMLTGGAFVTIVLLGAVTTLDAAQYRKYAQYDPSYLDFIAHVGWWGPRLHVYKHAWDRLMPKPIQWDVYKEMLQRLVPQQQDKPCLLVQNMTLIGINGNSTNATLVSESHDASEKDGASQDTAIETQKK